MNLKRACLSLAVTICLTMSVQEGLASESKDAASEPAPTDEASAEGRGSTSGWFRIDHDDFGLQLWLASIHDLGAFEAGGLFYVDPTNQIAEVDVGVLVPVGPFLFIPVVGINANWERMKFDTLVLGVFAYGFFQPVHLEWWSEVYVGSLFDEGGVDYWYNRLFALYSLTDAIAVGPQAEMYVALNESAKNFNEEGVPVGSSVTSIPIGGRINVGAGKNNTIGVFFGVETVDSARADGNLLAGRLTFVRTW